MLWLRDIIRSGPAPYFAVKVDFGDNPARLTSPYGIFGCHIVMETHIVFGSLVRIPQQHVVAKGMYAGFHELFAHFQKVTFARVIRGFAVCIINQSSNMRNNFRFKHEKRSLASLIVTYRSREGSLSHNLVHGCLSAQDAPVFCFSISLSLL